MQSKDIEVGGVYAVHTGYSVPRDALYRSYESDIEKMKVVEINVPQPSGHSFGLADMDAVIERGKPVEPRTTRMYLRSRVKNGVLVEYLANSNASDYEDRKPKYRKGDRIVVKPQRVLELHADYVARKATQLEQRERAQRQHEEKKREAAATAKRVNARMKKLGLTNPATGESLDFTVYDDGSVERVMFDAGAFEKLLDQLGVSA